MARHIHVHARGKARDIGRSTPELLQIVQDPAADERDVKAAIDLLVLRGLNPRTGAYVGVQKAKSIAQEMGDRAQS